MSNKRTTQKEWTVYILRCGDGTLYTGIAKHLSGRLKQHQRGKGASYTRSHLPVVLIYAEEGLTHSEALRREASIKRLPRKKKMELVRHGPVQPFGCHEK